METAPSGSLELVIADITKPDSLKADLFQGVRAVICCTAVKVSPQEGDTANRDKYNQVGVDTGVDCISSASDVQAVKMSP